MTTVNLDFLVNRSDLHQTQLNEGSEPGALSPGEVLFRVDRFAFTANNVTYAFAGDMLGYWRFFPAPEGLGRIPVMGYADVVASTHPEVEVGTRCFGFFPMSRYLVIAPGKVSATTIEDGAAHRADLAPLYRQYSPVGSDAMYSADHEDETLLMRGMFLTSFLCDDLLTDNDHFGAESVIITSASSKTSIALADLISRSGLVRAVGLTSNANREFVEDLGCYDEVLTYDEIKSLPADEATVIVDMAGSDKVLGQLHHRLGDHLKHSLQVGKTHWSAAGASAGLPGPKPEMFFAPSQVQKRTEEWGAVGFQERIGAAWATFRDSTQTWLEVHRGYGAEAVELVYQRSLDGKIPPVQGQILSLWDTPEEASGASAE